LHRLGAELQCFRLFLDEHLRKFRWLARSNCHSFRRYKMGLATHDRRSSVRHRDERITLDICQSASGHRGVLKIPNYQLLMNSANQEELVYPSRVADRPDTSE